MTSPRVLIIGGGIGGLTTAIALHRIGLQPRIVEQAPALSVVGSGITIQANAGAVFDALGIVLPPEDIVPIGEFKMMSGERVLMTGDSAKLSGSSFSVNIHRADLQAALVRTLEAAGGTLELGKRAAAIRARDEVVDVIFEDGEMTEVDLVLGADGLNSTVRRLIFGSSGSRYSGQTCWRFAVPFPQVPKVTVERWAPGKRAGLVPLSGGRVYGYLVESAPAGTPGEGTSTAAHVKARFGGMHAELDAVLERLQEFEAASPEGSSVLHHGDLRDQPYITFGKGRVVLLGDAAHATTPNLGQGAGMAIEDAASVAIALGSGAVSCDGLETWLEGVRLDRVKQVQKTSWRIGAVAHWQNGVARWCRDRMMSWVPKSVADRQAKALYGFGEELADELRGVLAARGG